MLFINFVPTSIYRPQVCLRTTEKAARDAGLRLDQLVFEVTEGHLVRDVDHLAQVFDYYRERGCRVALDDLGAGYSSLNMLIRLQPDFVKLDKDIVQALPDPVSSAVISAIVEITHAYGGKVLAECIETREQAIAARDLGVDLGQGWLFGRPVRPDVEPAAARPTVALGDPARPDPAVAVLAAALPSGPLVSPTAEPVAPAVPRQALPPAAVRTPDAGELQALLAGAVESSANGVVVVDMLAPDSPMIYVNAAFESLSGYTSAELVGRNCRLLQTADTDREVVFRLSLAVRQGVEHRCVLLNQRKDGTPWWNELHLSPVHAEDGRLTHYLGFQHDVTPRVEAEQQLLHLAGHDGLTGLSNRQTLVEELDQALARAKRDHRALAVLFIDLDGFKDVNDTLGHSVGDTVLVQATRRLRGALRTHDLLARTGGDEFVAVLADLDHADAERVGVRVAQEAIAALQRSAREGDVQVPISASVGVAVFPDGGHVGEELLRAADAAMYDAKAAGGATVRVSARTAGHLREPAAPPQRQGAPSQALR
jgi:diguanylate cyclase (GGDEF)-like protein/PAS domain S-box-containing protein